ncbi:MAG: putative drug exporter of the superfamily [Thermoleophilaceae bacterium]|jgi:RND superfamily putative drug exporter|nr:putative drug exporter of the superfamily [Thermoleophilaceae bacterium]
MIDRLARLADRRARRVLVFAAVFFVLAGALGAGVADRLDPYGAEDPDTESVIADQRLEHAGFRDTGLVVLVEGVDPHASAGRARVDALSQRLERDPDVASVAGFDNTGSPDFVSRDGRSTYLAVALKPTGDDALQDSADRIAGELAGEPGVTVGGPAVAFKQVNQQVERDLRTAELYAFPLLFMLSLLFFRSAVAALLPLLVGGLAIVGTFLVLRVASELTSVSIFALNLVTGLGLGLAIDYSLFIVSRYREEIARTGPGPEAMRRTLATAGRTVLFSSLTVAGAIASLVVFPQRFLYSMGIGGFCVALIAAAIALIVLPAVLTLLGARVNSLTPAFLARRAERDARVAEEGFWYRLSRLVMRFPGRIAAATATLLIVLGIPFLGINFTSVDAQVLPKSTSARQVDDTLRSQFPPYRDTPVTLAVNGGRGEAARAAQAAAAVPGAAAVGQPRELRGGTYAIDVVSKAPPLDDRSRQLVRDLRALDGNALVTGSTAHYLDLRASLVDHLPLVLAIVALVTLAVLFAMTGSVILPLKQVLMNALGLSAVFGILVLIFQDGRFEGLLGYTSQGGLESTQPLLLFAVVFGLSTDYGVFLLARIKEARDAGHSDSEAVAVGLERTGRIVTAAALLFCIAIGAFVTSKIIFIKELGLGTAIAVLIDATIIRALLVPALMQLLGRWNWWAPAPLSRLYERIGLKEA